MKRWVRCLLIVTEIGGGFGGLTGLLIERPWSTSIPPDSILSALFGVLYIFGIIAGLTLVEWQRLGIKLSLVYQALQIPIVASPLLTYEFFSGLQIGVCWYEDRVIALFQIGFRIVLSVTRQNPWGGGLNLLALTLFVYLLLKLRPKVQDVAPCGE